MDRALLGAAVVALALAGCRDEYKARPPVDGGLVCGVNERVLAGECQFVCDRDADCATGERCNLLTGTCEPRPPEPDSGVPQVPCTTGAERCTFDNKAVEVCNADARWEVKESCAPPSGFCLNERCLACQPGSASCHPTDATRLNVCLDDGSAFREVRCATGGACTDGECRLCEPNTTRCSANVPQVCRKGSDETASWVWVNNGDAFDGTCITGVCEAGSGTTPARCKAPECFPGTSQCKDATTQLVCSNQGAWTEVACPSTSSCQAGVCVDECAEAIAEKSYFGCEYWSAIQDNAALDLIHKKISASSTTPTQGTVDSEFAFVVSNRSVNAATVEVFRWFNGAEQRVKSVQVPGRNDATKGLATIKVPWQSIGPTSVPNVNRSTTGQLRYGYKVKSNRPITLYQFNPLDAVLVSSKSCSASEGTTDLFCNESGGTCNFLDMSGCGICETAGAGKRCHYYTYSNDASLLLPAHILGTKHVVVTQEHSNIFNSSGSQAKDQLTGHVTVVAPHPNTTVTIRSSAETNASPAGYAPAIAAMTKGSTHTFTLAQYDVLQIASAPTASTADQLQCSGGLFGTDKLCRLNNDLTGTVITSDKPVAVFGGASCSLKPYDTAACDHLEEQVFPFDTWGKAFVAVQSHPVRLMSGGFASANNASPNYWKVVASCPLTQCPNGTTVRLSAPPASADVLPPNRCLGGTSLAANNCRLAGGSYMEFKSKGNFTVTADYPIAVAQFFAGQSATSGSGNNAAATGDPSFILLPPVEQWRSNYTVLAAPNIRDNYLGLVIDQTKVASIQVDGVAVPLTDFALIPSTNYLVRNHPVAVGTHTITVLAKPGQVPAAGVTVYGFDSYVSYGYTGGLDLSTIVTGIDPGG